MKIGKRSMVLYTLAGAAFAGAVYLLIAVNIAAGLAAVCLSVLCVICGSVAQIGWQRNEIFLAVRKNFEKEKEDLRKTIQKQEKEIEVLQDSLAENMIQSINGTAGKEDTELFVKEEEQLINLTEEAVLAAEKYQPFAEILGIRIQVSAMEEAIIVRVSRSNIRKIFANILENSLKYMGCGGVIVITLSKIENQIFMVIKDNGKGCPKEETGKLFDRFYQGSEESSGSGMGLSVVKEIVEQYAGTIYAKSEPGKGMAIYIQLPGTWVKEEKEA